MKFDVDFKSTLQRQHMSFKELLVVCLCLSGICSISLKVSVDKNEGPVCFYESLQKDQKYMFKIQTDTMNYRMDVMYQDPTQSGGWREVAVKPAKRYTQAINKIAEFGGTYTFCISTSEERILKATFEIQTKLQLANFDYLPNLDDQENLNREVEFMDKQKQKMFEILNRMQGLRTSSQQIKSMMGVTMVVLAILGVVLIAAVNLMFYLLAKKTLKDRKLI